MEEMFYFIVPYFFMNITARQFFLTYDFLYKNELLILPKTYKMDIKVICNTKYIFPKTCRKTGKNDFSAQ